MSSAPAPITHPLFGAEPPQHVPLNPAMPQQYQQQLPQQMQQQYGYDQFAPQYGAPPQNLTRQVRTSMCKKHYVSLKSTIKSLEHSMYLRMILDSVSGLNMVYVN